MEDTPVITETPATADVQTSETSSQPDLENLSLSQLDTMFEEGKVTIPAQADGGGKVKDAPPLATEVETPGAKPVVEPEPPAVEEKVAETRSEAEIQAAVDAAIEAVQKVGGDAKAQRAAADAAAAPVAAEPTEPVIETEDEVAGIQRPRLKNRVDQLIAGVFKEAEAAGKPISWAEAERRIKGDAPVKTEAPVVETPPDHTAVVGTLETEVATLKEQLDAAGAAEGLFTPEIAKLTQELAEKTSDLKLAQYEARQAQKQSEREEAELMTASETNRATSRVEAIADYPAVADDTTPLGKAVAEEIAAMKNPKHPDHAILFADSAPLLTVQKVARKLGIAPVAKKATTPAVKPKVETPPPRKLVSPVPGNKSSVVPGKPAEDAKQAIEYLRGPDATLEELDAVQGMPDESRLLAGAVR
jgi:hypothetical protein